MGRFSQQLNQKFTDKYADYRRELYQSYFTAPEWRNVEMSSEFAEFLKAGKPFYRYPYLRQLKGFWSVFYQSLKVSLKYHKLSEVVFSEYMVMNMFIGIITTVEFLAKGLSSLLISALMPKENKTSFQIKVSSLFDEYAKFIHHTPFFNYSYYPKIKELYKGLKQAKDKSLADYVTFVVVALELLARAILSAPVAWFYNQPQNQAADKIHLLVKSKSTTTLNQIRSVDRNIAILDHENNKNSKSKENFKYIHVTIPRYKKFQEIILKLMKKKIKVQSIAGQDRIMFKALADDSKLSNLSKKQIIYAYHNYIDTNKKYVALNVKCSVLSQTVENLNKNNMEIKLMHDF